MWRKSFHFAQLYDLGIRFFFVGNVSIGLIMRKSLTSSDNIFPQIFCVELHHSILLDLIEMNLFVRYDFFVRMFFTIKDKRIKNDGVDVERFENFTVCYFHKIKKGTEVPFPVFRPILP